MVVRKLNPASQKRMQELVKTIVKSRGLDLTFELDDFLESAKISKLSKYEAIAKIANYYRNNNLVLVLGAGVSIDSGLPTWNDLLQELITLPIRDRTSLNDEQVTVISQLFNLVLRPNNLIEARYISNYFSELEKKDNKPNLFEKAVQKILYKDYDSTKESELLKKIVQLCISPGSNHSLNSVITYNYDDLLENQIQKIEKAGVLMRFKSIYTIGQNPKPNELPIYHVHGFLPRDGKITQINNITLGDNSYHSQYSEVYKWSNLVQLNKFKDYNCLFIGNSLTDPNQRRLLDIAKQQRGNDEIVHFLIKKKYSAKELETRLKNILSTEGKILSEKEKANMSFESTLEKIIDIVHKFETNDAHSFGIEIIWVNNYKDIKSLLNEIEEKSHL